MSLWSELLIGLRTLHTTLDSWLESKDREYTERVSLHDWDLPLDGAEYLAEAEAEVEVWAPWQSSCDPAAFLSSPVGDGSPGPVSSSPTPGPGHPTNQRGSA